MNDLAEFLANLMGVGMTREQIAEKGYEYALAQQIGQQPKGETFISPTAMSIAASQLQQAFPEARRIQEMRNRTW